MKNLILILIAAFVLLFALGKFGQVEEKGQPSGSQTSLDQGKGIVEKTGGAVQEMLQSVSRKVQSAVAQQGAVNKGKVNDVHDKNKDTATEVIVKKAVVKGRKVNTEITQTKADVGKSSDISVGSEGNIPTPALQTILREPANQTAARRILQEGSGGTDRDYESHSIEEVIAVSRSNASRFRRINKLINGD